MATSLFVSCQGTKENEFEVSQSIPATLQQCTIVYAVQNPPGVVINSQNTNVADSLYEALKNLFSFRDRMSLAQKHQIRPTEVLLSENIVHILTSIYQFVPPNPNPTLETDAATKLAKFVVSQGLQGLQTENVVKLKEVNNAAFNFFSPTSPYFDFYQWEKLRLCLANLFPIEAATRLVHPDELQKNISTLELHVQNLSFQNLHSLLSDASQLLSEIYSQIKSYTEAEVTETGANNNQSEINDNVPDEYNTLDGQQIEELQTLLRELTGSKNSIKDTKGWILERTDHSQHIAYVLRKAVQAESDPDRRLYVLYLLSECLHQVLKMRPMDGGLDEFSEAVKNQLKHIIHPIYTDQVDKTKSKIKQILVMWKDRSIFDEETINYITRILEKPYQFKAKKSNEMNVETNKGPSISQLVDMQPVFQQQLNMSLQSFPYFQKIQQQQQQQQHNTMLNSQYQQQQQAIQSEELKQLMQSDMHMQQQQRALMGRTQMLMAQMTSLQQMQFSQANNPQIAQQIIQLQINIATGNQQHQQNMQQLQIIQQKIALLKASTMQFQPPQMNPQPIGNQPLQQQQMLQMIQQLKGPQVPIIPVLNPMHDQTPLMQQQLLLQQQQQHPHPIFPQIPPPMPLRRADPNMTMPVGILVTHFKQCKPPPYQPLILESMAVSVPPLQITEHLEGVYNSFLASVEKMSAK